MRIGLISDTHGQLRSEVFEHLEGVERILHAGDIGNLDIITELETIAPVLAVHGNTDDFEIRNKFGAVVDVELGGKRVVVTHGHYQGAPTPANLRAAHPHADVIVYGHTHKPLHDPAVPVVINPGAAGPARFKLKPTIAILELPSLEVRFIEL